MGTVLETVLNDASVREAVVLQGVVSQQAEDFAPWAP